MTDCDILVKHKDSLKAWYLLQKNGFSHKPSKSPLHKKMLIHTGKHLPSLSKDGFIIEIHHNLFESEIKASEDYIDPFDTAVQISIGDTKAFTLSQELQLKYLISHFKRHLIEGSCQLRLYTDIILLDNTSEINIPDSFIQDPDQENKPEFRKAAYKAAIKSVPAKYRFQYITWGYFPFGKMDEGEVWVRGDEGGALLSSEGGEVVVAGVRGVLRHRASGIRRQAQLELGAG